MNQPSLWTFVIHANIVVKVVMLILLLASIASWTLIFQRISLLRKFKKTMQYFENQFWSSTNLETMYKNNSLKQIGLGSLFHVGYEEFNRLKQQPHITPDATLAMIKRTMHIAQTHELDQLQHNISFLATVGSISPYIGLFGTVWGIMSSFQALGNVGQATISMVAPGISEALIATAIGLFAAIPAVIAYNRFTNHLENIDRKFEIFQESLINIFQRQLYIKN